MTVTVAYMKTRVTVSTQQTFLQVSQSESGIQLTGVLPCKVEHNQT